MPVTKARGDRVVDLGSLGPIHCRPGLRALEALDAPDGNGALVVRLQRLSMPFSSVLTDVVDILYECHVDACAAEGREPKSREQIGDAVLEVGLHVPREVCHGLLLTAFGPVEVRGDDDENPQKAGTTTEADSKASDSSPSPLQPSGFHTATLIS